MRPVALPFLSLALCALPSCPSKNLDRPTSTAATAPAPTPAPVAAPAPVKAPLVIAEPAPAPAPRATPATTATPAVAAKAAVVAKVPAGLPAEGVVSELQNGDLACYVILKDAQGKEHNLMGEFELCETPALYVTKRVRLSYQAGSVNDCESNEPCGKSKRVQLVHRMLLLK